MYVCIYLSISFNLFSYIYRYIWITMFMYLFIKTYVCMYVCMYVCIYLSIYLSIFLNPIYVCTYFLCMYISTYLNRILIFLSSTEAFSHNSLYKVRNKMKTTFEHSDKKKLSKINTITLWIPSSYMYWLVLGAVSVSFSSLWHATRCNVKNKKIQPRHC